MPQNIKTIAVIGDGGWGTTLAVHLARKKYRVRLWGAFSDYVRYLNRRRENTRFLPGIKIPGNVAILDDLGASLKGSEVVILAVPSQYATSVIRRLKAFDLSNKIILSVIKGIETGTLLRISQIARKEFGNIRFAVLSGPTIATEVATGIPSTAVIASTDKPTAGTLQRVINSETFRIYTNTDVIGVELGGSIKNVIALACGICDGLGFGTNTKAAILTRGLAEMTRLSTAMGAKSQTLFGLSGLGDLVTTSVNPNSRNRSVGEALGRGRSIRQIVRSMAMVAEGVTTAKAIYALSKKHRVSMPITGEVYNIIYRNKKPSRAVRDLMRRELKPE